MTPLSYSSVRSEKFENPLNVKVTNEMLYHIQTGAENRNISMSDFIRYLIFLGIKSVEET